MQLTCVKPQPHQTQPVCIKQTHSLGIPDAVIIVLYAALHFRLLSLNEIASPAEDDSS